MVDNVSAGYAGTVLIAYMSSLTSAGFTATQYALFTSLYSLPGKLIAAQSGTIVEASARLAAPGGPFAGLTGWFTRLPPASFATGAAELGVPAAALGAGYLVFFFYSCLIGLGALVLALIIARRQPSTAGPGSRPPPQRPRVGLARDPAGAGPPLPWPAAAPTSGRRGRSSGSQCGQPSGCLEPARCTCESASPRRPKSTSTGSG